MITEAIINVFVALAEWFIGLFGDDDPPSWIEGAAGAVTDVLGYAAGLGAWFPFVVLGAVAGFLIGLWIVLWSIKGGRWVWGLTPLSGGS